jgi:hypothetical protein
VPKDTGALEESGFYNEQTHQISFDTPYARRLYYNPQYNFRHDKNINAQGLWLEMYTEEGEKKYFVTNTFLTFLKRNSGGVIK